jgi:exonuclease I
MKSGVDGGLYAGFVSTADQAQSWKHLRTLPAADQWPTRAPALKTQRLEEVVLALSCAQLS